MDKGFPRVPISFDAGFCFASARSKGKRPMPSETTGVASALCMSASAPSSMCRNEVVGALGIGGLGGKLVSTGSDQEGSGGKVGTSSVLRVGGGAEEGFADDGFGLCVVDGVDAMWPSP